MEKFHNMSIHDSPKRTPIRNRLRTTTSRLARPPQPVVVVERSKKARFFGHETIIPSTIPISNSSASTSHSSVGSANTSDESSLLRIDDVSSLSLPNTHTETVNLTKKSSKSLSVRLYLFFDI
jgi:hypothetical protein